MSKKIIGVIGLVLVLGLVGVVIANSYYYNDSRSEYEMTVFIEKGWNIVQGFHPDLLLEGSDINKQDIKAIFLYSPDKNNYIEMYPNFDLPNAGLDPNDEYYDDSLNLYSYWVYSERSGNVKYRLDPFGDISIVPMKKGWNFVGINPTMIGKIFDNIKGDCNLLNLHVFDSSNQEWSPNIYEVDYDDLTINAFPEGLVGVSYVIKVSSDCTLRSSGDSGTNPPSLPGNGESNTGLRKMIEDYYYDELAYEECDLNEAKEYTSKADCESAWRCLAIEYAKLIPEIDLEDVVGEMSEHGGEAGAGNYAEENPSVDEQIRATKFSLCLAGKHESY